MAECMTTIKAGCLFDGSAGQYGVAYMVSLAAVHGYDDFAVIAAARRHLASLDPLADEVSKSEIELLTGSADAVQEWLNDNAAPVGYSFGWYDGEFLLCADEWWKQD